MTRTALSGVSLALFGGALLLATPPAPGAGKDVQKFERTLAFKPDPQKLGIKAGDVTIESVEIKNWPDAEDFAKGAKDLNDTKTMWIVFTYTNRDTKSDYKCRYTVTVPDPDGGAPWAQNDSTRSLDAGKVDDTNRFGVRMRTHQYRLAKTMKLGFEIWKK